MMQTIPLRGYFDGKQIRNIIVARLLVNRIQ